MFKLKTFLNSTLFTFLFAVLGGIVTYWGMPAFEQAKQPFLTPPAFVFPIVWTLLYLLMSFSAAIIYDAGDEGISKAPKALFVYVVQLTFNFWWCVLFFGFRLYFVSFIWLLLLIILVISMIILFTRINRTAGLIQLAYLVWLLFAAYLNLVVWLLN